MEGWSVRFRLDGVLIAGAGEDTLLDGRAAALVTYLAVEGPTSRRALAALLWPDTEPHRGRANLRKLLSRLGRLRNALSGPDPLELRPEVTTNEEELLPESLGLADASSLTAWLEQACQRRRQHRITWLHGEIERHEVAVNGRAARRGTGLEDRSGHPPRWRRRQSPSEPLARPTTARCGSTIVPPKCWRA